MRAGLKATWSGLVGTRTQQTSSWPLNHLIVQKKSQRQHVRYKRQISGELCLVQVFSDPKNYLQLLPLWYLFLETLNPCDAVRVWKTTTCIMQPKSHWKDWSLGRTATSDVLLSILKGHYYAQSMSRFCLTIQYLQVKTRQIFCPVGLRRIQIWQTLQL